MRTAYTSHAHKNWVCRSMLRIKNGIFRASSFLHRCHSLESWFLSVSGDIVDILYQTNADALYLDGDLAFKKKKRLFASIVEWLSLLFFYFRAALHNDTDSPLW